MRDPDLPRFHPQQEVADHEVLLAFNGDDDATMFHVWWNDSGLAAFKQWVEKERKLCSAS